MHDETGSVGSEGLLTQKEQWSQWARKTDIANILRSINKIEIFIRMWTVIYRQKDSISSREAFMWYETCDNAAYLDLSMEILLSAVLSLVDIILHTASSTSCRTPAVVSGSMNEVYNSVKITYLDTDQGLQCIVL